MGNLAFSSATPSYTHVSQTDSEIQGYSWLLGEMVLDEDVEKQDADLGIQVSDATVHQISTGTLIFFFFSFLYFLLLMSVSHAALFFIHPSVLFEIGIWS